MGGFKYVRPEAYTIWRAIFLKKKKKEYKMIDAKLSTK